MGDATGWSVMKEDNQLHQKLQESIKSDIEKLERFKKERSKMLAQTVFLGTLGLIFVLPVVAGAYLGVWLDNKLRGFSISWTINLILLGVIIGAINVYFFIKGRSNL